MTAEAKPFDEFTPVDIAELKRLTDQNSRLVKRLNAGKGDE